jgi:DinB superfamily/Pentapeptide repeats (8 copies)
MPGEFEGDLTEAVFWGADMRSARFRDVNFTGVRISHSWVVDVDIDAFVDRLVVNGVDVTEYVNERDEWYPVRAMIRASDPDGLRAAWAALEEVWASTIVRAEALGEEKAQESVNEEFSFVQTVRHLVFAMEKWFNVPILGESFHAMGLPNTGSLDFPWPGLDYSVKPSLGAALAVRADRAATFRAYLANVDAADLPRQVEVLENGKATVLDCLQTVMEEEFWHNRYAQRDLAVLE